MSKLDSHPVAVGVVLTALLCLIFWPNTHNVVLGASNATRQDWRTDPVWYQGKAEWALYDAVRTIYGKPRHYEATIFTNKQYMDPVTTTKAADWRDPNAIEVFKHNVSEMIPTDNYTYRFLTTCFVHTDTLELYKLVASSQEDCGATYKQFIVADGQVEARSYSYFPDEGESHTPYRRPGQPRNFAFHDALTLTLRDYPFDADEPPVMKLKLIADQTNNHATPQGPEEATVRLVGRESITVPYGTIDAHHLVVEHTEQGGTTSSEYWFAADEAMRHVLVKYQGPYGVKYELKRLDWWAYWSEPRPEE